MNLPYQKKVNYVTVQYLINRFDYVSLSEGSSSEERISSHPCSTPDSQIWKPCVLRSRVKLHTSFFFLDKVIFHYVVFKTFDFMKKKNCVIIFLNKNHFAGALEVDPLV